jgi:hypothetical protein
MTCEHSETTTVAWLYGEAPEEHLHHVVGCAACQSVVEEHEAVGAALAEVLPALRSRPVLRSAPAPEARVQRPSFRGAWLLGALAVAAGALFALRFALPPPPAGEEPRRTSPEVAQVATGSFRDDVDRDLEVLEADLDAFADDLESL